jgi:hypothetical protein
VDTMRRMVGVAALALVAVGSAAAQNPPGGQPPAQAPDQAMPFQGANRGAFRQQRAEQLRMQIEERFAQRVQVELGLTEQQMDRLRTAERANRDRHLALQDHEQDLRRAVGEQLKPGVAANADSLSRLLDAIAANHVARAQEEQQEIRDLAQFLSPVQRARLLIMRQQLQARVQAILQGRRFPQPGMPGMPGGPDGVNPGPGVR